VKFQLKNSNVFPVPGNNHMLHLATISGGLREFIVMLCVRGEKRGQCYIEEVVLNTVDWSSDVYANCKFIDDDHLAEDLEGFAREKGITDIKKVQELLIDRGRTSWVMPVGSLKS
jgi:hypothetical protein